MVEYKVGESIRDLFSDENGGDDDDYVIHHIGPVSQWPNRDKTRKGLSLGGPVMDKFNYADDSCDEGEAVQQVYIGEHGCYTWVCLNKRELAI